MKSFSEVAFAGIAVGMLLNLFWFGEMGSFETLPVLPVLGAVAIGLGIGAWTRGDKAGGALAIVIALPATAMTGFILLFFALGGSR